MEKAFDKVWINCLEIIKDIVEWQHFKTWFEPIKPVALKEKILTIQVPSQFFYEYLEEHYVSLLAKTLKRELGKEARLEYRIMVDSGNSKNKPLTMDVPGHGFKSYSNNEMDFPLVINNPVKNPFVIPGLKKMQIDPQLNPAYTFEAFIEGDCNRVARRAGKTVAEKKLAKPVAKFQKPSGNVKKQQTTLQRLTEKAKSASGYAKRAAETDAVAELLKGLG